MHEILRSLRDGDHVLDLGCQHGSFDPGTTRARVVRIDREPGIARGACTVQGDASALPFATGSFAAVVANHSLEHFDDLDGAVAEIARVLRSDGALFVSVPDASTLTDRLYRWLARGGGHVNAFRDAGQLAQRIEAATGLKHVATRTLYSSLSFMNRARAVRPLPGRMILVGGGFEWTLFAWAWLSRRIDRAFGLRTSVYGWAMYFGNVPEAPDTTPMVNVCIRCGSGCSGQAGRAGLLSTWRCPDCGAVNPLYIL